jgi:hypothetical protein
VLHPRAPRVTTPSFPSICMYMEKSKLGYRRGSLREATWHFFSNPVCLVQSVEKSRKEEDELGLEDNLHASATRTGFRFKICSLSNFMFKFGKQIQAQICSDSNLFKTRICSDSNLFKLNFVQIWICSNSILLRFEFVQTWFCSNADFWIEHFLNLNRFLNINRFSNLNIFWIWTDFRI